MRFSLLLADADAATFDLPAGRDPEAIGGLGDFADLADAAYDLEDTDAEAARDAYDRALLVAAYQLGALDEPPAAPQTYDPVVVEDVAAMLYNRAGTRFDLDDLEGAIEDLDASLAVAQAVGIRGEGLAEVFVRRAETRFALANVEGAFADLDAALAEDPEHALAFNNRALYHAELGDMDAAFADIARALDAAPEDALLHVSHAELLAQTGDDDAALTALETALDLDPDAEALLDADVFDGLRKQPRFKALLGR